MTLSLDHRQRLNLITVLGASDVRGRELHAIWHLQDLLELDEAEKAALELREETMNGQLVRKWNDRNTIPSKFFDLSEADLSRIREAIQEFPQMRASRDRVWLEPLLAQLPDAGESNSAKA